MRGLPGACGSDVGLTSECFLPGPSGFSVRAACRSAEQGDLPFSVPTGARCAPVAATKGAGIPFTEIEGLYGDLVGDGFCGLRLKSPIFTRIGGKSCVQRP